MFRRQAAKPACGAQGATALCCAAKGIMFPLQGLRGLRPLATKGSEAVPVRELASDYGNRQPGYGGVGAARLPITSWRDACFAGKLRNPPAALRALLRCAAQPKEFMFPLQGLRGLRPLTGEWGQRDFLSLLGGTHVSQASCETRLRRSTRYSAMLRSQRNLCSPYRG